MSNTTRLIMIWGFLIGMYLLVSNSTGAKQVINSFGGFVNGTTRTLQGRNA